MNIQQAAKTSGLTADTIRFYERQMVLPRPPRQENGYRNYTSEHVATLRLAAGLRHLGVSLEMVGPILQVAHDAACSVVREQMTETLTQVLPRIETQIADLINTRDHLVGIIQGLESMETTDSAVPGMQPCECVRLVSDV